MRRQFLGSLFFNGGQGSICKRRSLRLFVLELSLRPVYFLAVVVSSTSTASQANRTHGRKLYCDPRANKDSTHRSPVNLDERSRRMDVRLAEASSN